MILSIYTSDRETLNASAPYPKNQRSTDEMAFYRRSTQSHHSEFARNFTVRDILGHRADVVLNDRWLM